MIPSGTERNRLACGGIAVQFDVGIDVGRALAEAVRDQLHFIGMRDEIGHAVLRLRVKTHDRVLLGLGAVAIQNLVHRFRCQVFVKVVIDLNRGSPTAGSDALYFFQGKELVGRGFLVANPQLFLAMRQ